jgi:hypothetical protein
MPGRLEEQLVVVEVVGSGLRVTRFVYREQVCAEYRGSEGHLREVIARLQPDLLVWRRGDVQGRELGRALAASNGVNAPASLEAPGSGLRPLALPELLRLLAAAKEPAAAQPPPTVIAFAAPVAPLPPIVLETPPAAVEVTPPVETPVVAPEPVAEVVAAQEPVAEVAAAPEPPPAVPEVTPPTPEPVLVSEVQMVVLEDPEHVAAQERTARLATLIAARTRRRKAAG